MKVSWGFVLHKERSGRYAIRARIRIKGKPSDVGLGVSLHSPSDWDGRRQRVRTTSNESALANIMLTAVDCAISDIIARAAIEHRLPTREEVSSSVMEAAGREVSTDDKSIGFYDLFDKFTITCGRDHGWTSATFRKFETLRRHLKSFDSHIRLENLTASKLTYFAEFLTKKGFRNSYTMKLCSFLRWFLRWAYGSGFYEGQLHQTWRVKLKGPKEGRQAVVYLTIEELQRMEAADLSEHRDLEAIRDVFVFCCYSGLRFSDAAALKAEDIHDGSIHIVTKKTSDTLTIELNSHTKAIIEKWRGLPKGKVLPTISNQNTNYRLKELARLVGIESPVHTVHFIGSKRFDEVHPKWEVLTTHAARRTFVVTALTLGIPAEVIIRWTGHSDFKAMKPYMAIVDEVKRERMASFDKISAPQIAPRNLCNKKRKSGSEKDTPPLENY